MRLSLPSTRPLSLAVYIGSETIIDRVRGPISWRYMVIAECSERMRVMKPKCGESKGTVK